MISILGMQSCKKCYNCKRASVEDVVCKLSNESQKEFKAIITLAEAQGWQCK